MKHSLCIVGAAGSGKSVLAQMHAGAEGVPAYVCLRVVCICVYTCIHMCVCVYLYVSTFIHIDLSIYIYIYLHACK
jgi:hypothetical protein